MTAPLPEDLHDATPRQLRDEIVRLRQALSSVLAEVERLRAVEAHAREVVGLLLGATHTEEEA